MKQYEYIFFDLDGTLTDPGEGITNSVAYALRKFGIEVSDRTQLYKFIGPPLIDSFMKYYDFSLEEARTAVQYYREYYTDKGILENYVYDGIDALLKKLQSSGKKLCVATSKPEIFARKILEHFGLADYFYYIAGAALDESRTRKEEVIAYALEQCQITDSSKVVMVGDREYDVFGAKEFGMDSIGVLFGYGDRAEMEHAGADYIAETVEEIASFSL